jgi:hypothetical protein
MKTLYLDVCTYCHPFDNQDALRIRLETEAFYLILQYIQQNHYQSVVSPVHIKEIDAIENIEERLLLKAELALSLILWLMMSLQFVVVQIIYINQGLVLRMPLMWLMLKF